MPEQIADLAASWRRDMRAADKAERTIELYGQSVRFFLDWLTAQHRPGTVDQLTKHAIASWLESLHERGNQPQTVLTRYKGMRRFTRWLLAEGEVAKDPMANLEQPKPQMKAVPVLTDAEIERLLKTCAGQTFQDRRDLAILRVLFDCGLRISECSALRVDDVDLNNLDVLHVIGKGRKPRAVPFGAKTARALDRYLRARRQHPRAATTAALWLGERGGFSVDGLKYALERRAAQAGLDGVHAHRFRHTFAHRWLASGGQERDLMRLAGWTSDAMLDRYGSSTADERAREAFKKLRLGDRL